MNNEKLFEMEFEDFAKAVMFMDKKQLEKSICYAYGRINPTSKFEVDAERIIKKVMKNGNNKRRI